MAWAYFDPEYENLSIRINPPRFLTLLASMLTLFKKNITFLSVSFLSSKCASSRVSVDNSSCNDCTLVKVDSYPLVQTYCIAVYVWYCSVLLSCMRVEQGYVACFLEQVDSMNKPGILLEVVQILTDLDLTITKAHISSDGGWFMDGA